MKLYKTKLGRIMNFIRNERKYQRGDLVKVIKNTSEYKYYDKYINQLAVVSNIDYSKKDYIIGLKFLDGKNYDFKVCEIEKCESIEEIYSQEHINLLKML